MYSVPEYRFSDPFLPAYDAHPAYAAFIIVPLIFAVILAGYLLKGFGVYGMAKKQGLESPWLAFIPYASHYLEGQLAGEIKCGRHTIKNPGVWLLLAPVVYPLLLGIIFFVFAFAFTIFSMAFVRATMIPEFVSLSIFFFLFIIFIGNAPLTVFFGFIRYHIYKKYTKESSAVLHSVLGCIVPFYQEIYFFVLRNKEPVYFPSSVPYESDIRSESPDSGFEEKDSSYERENPSSEEENK